MRPVMNIKRTFEIACASAGITKSAFAARVGISKGCLADILSGRRKSARISRKIGAFTSRQFNRLGLQFASSSVWSFDRGGLHGGQRKAKIEADK